MRLQLILVLALGCTSEVLPAEPPPVDRCFFDREVYPVLARDCGFPTCHGSEERSLQVWSPGRARLGESAVLDPPTEEELQRSFDRARSMLAGAPVVEESLLLRKPLETGGHRGRDRWDRNVYAGEDPGWELLARWANGERCE